MGEGCSALRKFVNPENRTILQTTQNWTGKLTAAWEKKGKLVYGVTKKFRRIVDRCRRERRERERGGGRGRERKIKRPHRRNSTLGRTPGRIFRDAKIKARVLQVCTRARVLSELTLSRANKLHLHLHCHTNELDVRSHLHTHTADR